MFEAFFFLRFFFVCAISEGNWAALRCLHVSLPFWRGAEVKNQFNCVMINSTSAEEREKKKKEKNRPVLFFRRLMKLEHHFQCSCSTSSWCDRFWQLFGPFFFVTKVTLSFFLTRSWRPSLICFRTLTSSGLLKLKYNWPPLRSQHKISKDCWVLLRFYLNLVINVLLQN